MNIRNGFVEVLFSIGHAPKLRRLNRKWGEINLIGKKGVMPFVRHSWSRCLLCIRSNADLK